MSRALSFTLPGKPQGKQRPRFNRKTGRVYTPKETRFYERSIRGTANTTLIFWERSFVGRWPMDARYRLTVTAVFPDLRRRDVDNVAKAVADGLNGVLYDDDSQVAEMVVRRELDRENPRTVVRVEVLDDAR